MSALPFLLKMTAQRACLPMPYFLRDDSISQHADQERCAVSAPYLCALVDGVRPDSSVHFDIQRWELRPQPLNLRETALKGWH